MRKYPQDRAWDSQSFTCACPGGTSPCSIDQAIRDTSWIKRIKSLCSTGTDVIKPVLRSFYELREDACSFSSHSPGQSDWEKMTYPAYPDLPKSNTGQLQLSGNTVCQTQKNYVLCQCKDRIDIQFLGRCLVQSRRVQNDFFGVFSFSVAQPDPVPIRTNVNAPDAPECLVGEWEEWSECQSACIQSVTSPPRRRRRRLPFIGSVAQHCVLEEEEDCPFVLQDCKQKCWTAGWSEWSECISDAITATLSPVRSRYKPVISGAPTSCSESIIEEKQSCVVEGVSNLKVFQMLAAAHTTSLHRCSQIDRCINTIYG